MEVRIANIMIAVLVMALAILATDAAAEETIYRWVDENGGVHFGDTPPENATTEQVSVIPDTISQAPPSSAASGAEPQAPVEPQPSYAEQLRQERAEKRKEREEQQRILAEACAQRRTLVAQLEPSTRVMVQMEDGTVTRLDDNVRLETLHEAKSFIDKNCDK